MRTYSLAALILATVGTVLLSGIVLFTALSLMPDVTSMRNAGLESNLESANQLLDGAIWFWAVISVTGVAIVLAAGGVLTRARVRHHLLCRIGLTIAIVVIVQVGLEFLGLHSIETAIARVNTPFVPGIESTGWTTLDRERVLLAGCALVALIYAIAFCLQIAHDDRGTDRYGIVE